MTSVLEENQDFALNLDEVKRYQLMISHYPLLTPAEERDLAQRCARGDEEAIVMMVNSNLRLVLKIAREYDGKGVPMMDLIQEGNIGLLIAVRRYDPSRENRFSTYAYDWIRQRITRCILNHAGLIRVPTHTMERMRKILAVKASLKQELGDDPDVSLIAQHCGESEDKTRELLELVPQICSLDIYTGKNEDSALQALIEDLHTPQPQEELVRRELEQTVESLLQQLTPLQQRVLRLRFGMEDGVCYSLQQIGTILGTSKEGVRQTEMRAMDRMKKLGIGVGLEDFLQ